MIKPYNPLSTYNLARSIESEILRQPRRPLSELRQESGSGVYAIYYAGDHRIYESLVRSLGSKLEKPIYVGKAIPKGGRIGGITKDAAAGRRLGERLGIHADSIEEVENLDLTDFSARVLMIEDVWISLGENMLIQQFKPVWNVVASGFGNKAPGKGRQDQAMSLWDTIHPGRRHSKLLGPNRLSDSEIQDRVEKYLSGEDVPLSVEEDEGDDQ